MLVCTAVVSQQYNLLMHRPNHPGPACVLQAWSTNLCHASNLCRKSLRGKTCLQCRFRGVHRNTGKDGAPAFEHIKLVHSMAGAAVLIYLTDCLVKGEAHGISQIIAAGPAGFQRPKGQPSFIHSITHSCVCSFVRSIVHHSFIGSFVRHFLVHQSQWFGGS